MSKINYSNQILVLYFPHGNKMLNVDCFRLFILTDIALISKIISNSFQNIFTFVITICFQFFLFKAIWTRLTLANINHLSHFFGGRLCSSIC